MYSYVALTLIADCSLAWESLKVNEKESETKYLRITCFVVSCFSLFVFGALLLTAAKLIKINSKTEFD